MLICSELKCLWDECGRKGDYDCDVISVHLWEWRSGRAIRLGTGFVRVIGDRSVQEGVDEWNVWSRG